VRSWRCLEHWLNTALAARFNSRLQRSWPSFSSGIVAAITGVALVSMVLPLEAGHAAHSACSADMSVRLE
jgi:hypothetical protein